MKSFKYILSVSLAALTLASCENYFDEKQLDNHYKPTDVKSLNYTLTSDDYKAVTTNSKNVALALSLCTEEDSSAYAAFLQIAEDKAFNELATSDQYLPAFIYNKFIQLSMGSTCKVTYNINEGKPEYLGDFATAKDYVLTEADYQLAWGSDVDFVKYLTPKTVGKLSAILAASAAEGDSMLVVSYAYQENEPVFGGDPTPSIKTPIADMIAAYDAGTVKDGDTIEISGYIVSMFLKPTNFAKYGSVSVWLNDSVDGTLKQFELYNCYGFGGDTLKSFAPFAEGSSNVDVTEVSDGNGNSWKVGDYVTATGAITLYNGTYELKTGCHFVPNKKSAPARAAMANNDQKSIYTLASGTWAEYKNSKVSSTTLMNVDKSMALKFLAINFPYAKADDKVVLVYKNKGYEAAEYIYDGVEWAENTGLVSETLTFVLNQEWLANLSVYYKQAIVGEGQGDLFIQNVSLGEGITYVWNYDSRYGMKGTSYAGGPHAAEAWVVTPGIKLKNSKKPLLNFDQAINYGPNDETRYEEMSVWVSTDFAGDVTTCTWKQLPWNAWDEKTETGFPDAYSWTFHNSGDMSLEEFNGKTIYIGFRYKAEDGWTCSTWEFQNILVHEFEEKKEE